MDKTQTIEKRTGQKPLTANFDGDDDRRLQKRLETLLDLNGEYRRQKEIFQSEREQAEADLMTAPLTSEKAFSFFGLLLGALAPLGFFIKFFLESGSPDFEEWVVALMFIVNFTTALAGYFSGRLIGKIAFELEKLPWHWMVLGLPFLGLLWGIIAGGAGGIFIFIFGAIFGAMLGGMVGSIALPIFTVFHRLLKRGDKIDRKHFLPVAFGVSFFIFAFILGT